MINITTAVFDSGRYARTKEVFQYDYGQILRLQGLNLQTAVEIHFSLQKSGGTAITRVGLTKDGVTDVIIPDSLLENGDTTQNYTMYAFVYITDAKSGQTEYRVDIPITSRPKPEGFQKPSDTELFREAIKAVNDSADRAGESEKNAERWAVGRTDVPGSDTDNAKYYSTESKKNAQQTTKDKEAVAELVKQTSNIGAQVEEVKRNAQTAVESARNAKTSETNASASETNAKTSEAKASASETNAKKSEQAVEQAKTAVDKSKQAVDETVARFNQSVTEASQALKNEKGAHLQAITNAGTTETKKVTDEGTKQVKAVQTTGTAETGKVTSEGTKQVGAVRTEAEKHLQAITDATNGIVADRQQIGRNKADVTQLKEALTDLKPRVETLEKNAQIYSEKFLKNFFAMQRTGKVYTVRFPLWETSQVATGEKLDDNEGLVMEASTLEEKGRDDYSSIPLFKTYDCNVEQFLGKPKISAMRGDKEFDSKEKDTFVLGMSYYHKFWVQDGYMYYSRSDSPREGYVVCSEAKKKNGERPFCLYAKYVTGANSKGELGSFYGKNPTRSKISFNSSLSEAKKRGTGYIFGCSADYAYIQNTFMLKYANRNWNAVLGGCFGYSAQYKISTPEADTKRVILSKANAESFVIGSCVSVGDIGENGSEDRGSSLVHNICDSAKVLDIIDIDETNKALVLDVKDNITTTATTCVTSMHWRSGFSDRVKGMDGCPCDAKSQISSMKYPTVFQGIELAVGGREVFGNAFMDTLTDPLVRDTYVCDDSEKLTNNATTAKASWKKVAKQLTVEKNGAWLYGTELHMDLESGINVITKAGASGSGSNTGFCDGVYFVNDVNTQQEFLLLGDLWDLGIGGAFYSNGGGRLGSAWWLILARLSLSIYRGEFA